VADQPQRQPIPADATDGPADRTCRQEDQQPPLVQKRGSRQAAQAPHRLPPVRAWPHHGRRPAGSGLGGQELCRGAARHPDGTPHVPADHPAAPIRGRLTAIWPPP